MKNLNNYNHVFPEMEISNIEMDSRKIKDNGLFICIKGFTVDGHDFVSSAVKNGATVILAEREVESFGAKLIVVEDTTVEMALLAKWFYDDPVSKLKLIGVTGTNGKTTTTNILKHILGDEAGYIGTNGYSYHGNVFETKNTTPDSLTLYKIFDEFVQNDIKYVAMEVSSIALDLKRLFSVEFDVGVFSNLTHDHLDFHHTMENYLKSKAQLFSMLKEDGFGVINKDDSYFEQLNGLIECKHYTYSLETESDFKIKNINLKKDYSSFELNDIVYRYPMLGRFNMYNVLSALVTALNLGLDIETIQSRLLNLPVVDGRMEVVHSNDFTVIVDYAHTPDGLIKILEFANDVKKEKVHVLIGCPGNRDKEKRPVMAKIACDYATDVILTTDDPHSEDPIEILNEMEQGVLGYTNYEVIVDRTSAIHKIISNASKDDIVLIAGRGHQRWQYWDSGDIELDDRVVALEYILKTEQ
jgi:UDP-N-acetylmuramoyl-L-alanyl-D-glutamate--2,6-diaminopimelate ligase